MSYLKTKQTDANVIVFLNTIENDVKKQDCFKTIDKEIELISKLGKYKKWKRLCLFKKIV